MSEWEFWKKVWEYKRLPPLWMWKPAWLRRVTVALWYPPMMVICAVLLTILKTLIGLVEWLRMDFPESFRNTMQAARDEWHGQRPQR